MSTATIPVHIQPEADAFATEQGFRRELDEIIEQAKRVLPDLAAVMVTLEERYEFEGTDTPRMLITAEVQGTRAFEERSHRLWDRWIVESIPSEVLWHLCPVMVQAEADER